MTDYTEQIVDALSELMLRFPDMPAVVRNEFAEFILTGAVISTPYGCQFLQDLIAWCKTKPHGGVVESMFRYAMPCIGATRSIWRTYLTNYRNHMKRYNRLTNS